MGGSLLGSSLIFCFFNQAKVNPIHPLKLNLSICPGVVPLVYRLLSDVLSSMARWLCGSVLILLMRIDIDNGKIRLQICKAQTDVCPKCPLSVYQSTLALNTKENRLETIFPLGYNDSMLLWEDTMSRIELRKCFRSLLLVVPAKPQENMMSWLLRQPQSWIFYHALD